MLGLLVQGLAVGKRVLRQVEALGEDLVREGTGPEGLRRPVSDTTLDRVLRQMKPEGLDKVLQQSVRAALEQGVLRQDRLAAGVVSIDGKAGESTRGQAPCEPCHTPWDFESSLTRGAVTSASTFRLPPQRAQANTSSKNVLRGSPAQATRAVLCFLGFFTVAAKQRLCFCGPASVPV